MKRDLSPIRLESDFLGSHVLTPPLTGCGTLGKLPTLSVLHHFHHRNGTKKHTSSIGLLWRLNECLEQSLSLMRGSKERSKECSWPHEMRLRLKQDVARYFRILDVKESTLVSC